MLRLLPLLLLAACVEVGNAPPPGPGAPPPTPTLSILSPTDGEAVLLEPTPDRRLPMEVALTDFTLRPPGTCIAADGPCGHVAIIVEGCAGEDGLNGLAGDTPVGARLSLCDPVEGEHLIELRLLDDAGGDLGVSDSVSVLASLPPLLDRVGGTDEVLDTVRAAIDLHAFPDRNLNAYLHNSSLDLDLLADCAGAAVLEVAGGPPYGEGPLACPPIDGIFTEALGFSSVDYDDARRHLRDALLYHDVAPIDADELMARIDAQLRPLLVVDEDADASLYQRLGRLANIEVVVQDFGGRLIADPLVAGFFADLGEPPEYAGRTQTCISRLVCAVGGGPCRYGEGTEEALGGAGCRSMLESHADMRAPADAPDGEAIAQSHFDVVVGHLVGALTDAGVSDGDIGAIGVALGGTCPDIVAVSPDCPAP